MKTYPLVIEDCLEEYPGLHVIFSRGHHDAKAFIAAADNEYSLRWSDEVKAKMSDDVKHECWRFVPQDWNGEGGYIDSVPGRGAFPATVIRYDGP